MDAVPALKVAINLFHFPSQARQARSLPLPKGIAFVLRIAAGDEAVIRTATDATGRAPDVVKDAAAFFIEQILLSAEADSYRVLGATPEASARELRRNMALLLRWLHPDHDQKGERSVFAARVTGAWDDLKTQERRDAYDARHAATAKIQSWPQKAGRKRRRTDQHKRNKSRHLPAGGSGPQAGRGLVVMQQPKPLSLFRLILWALLGKAKS